MPPSVDPPSETATAQPAEPAEPAKPVKPAGDPGDASHPRADVESVLSSLGPRDDEPRVEFPSVDAAFPDGSSASSDGRTVTVTTPAEEKVSTRLPTAAEGWFSSPTFFMGDAGVGYLVTQSAGEFLDTNLLVLDDGKLYVAKKSDGAVFGRWIGEGAYFETFTVDGARLFTAVYYSDEDSPVFEVTGWTVRDRELVATNLATDAPDE